jgi:hypothetical protein
MFDDGARDHAPDRERGKRDQHYQPIAASRGHLHRDERGDDHHRLRDHDRGRREHRRITLAAANHRKPIEWQHRAVAEVKAGKRGCEDQHRLVAQQRSETLGLTSLGFAVIIPLQPACGSVIDRTLGNHQDPNDREHAEPCRQKEDRRHAELPPEPTGEPGADHVAGVVPRLVAAVLGVEASLPDDAEGHAGDRRTNRGACDGGRNLARRHDPTSLREKYQEGGGDRANAGYDHDQPLFLGVIYESARRRGHHHAGDAAQRHDGADRSGRPPLLLQEYAEKRANARLHVRHEEVERLKGAARLLLLVRPSARARCRMCDACHACSSCSRGSVAG